MTSRRSILVTGGLGFIGSHLCRALLRDEPDLQLTIIDNLSSTQIDYGDLQGRARILIQHLCDFDHTSTGFNEIYHLASPVGSLGILARNGFVARDILALTHKVAEIAIESRAQLLYVSSSEVYGREGTLDEETPKVIPERRGTRMEYALAKLVSEHVLFNLAIEHDLRFKICRPFNVIGEGQCSRIGFVVPTFFERALAGEDIPVFYGGAQKRSFCHVSDIVTALVMVQRKGRLGHIYNIGNPNDVTTIKALAERIVEMCSSASKIVDTDPQQIFGKQYIEALDKVPDIRKVSVDTNWEPTHNLNTSLCQIRNYYQSGRSCRLSI